MIPVFKELFRLCITTFFCSVLLVGCNETIDARQLKEINGLIYKIGENEPFTGTVINFSQYDRFSKFERWSCEVQFKKGELHGAYSCVSVNTGIKTNEKTYEHNFKTGLETIWNPEGKLISKTEWIGGRRNGVEELYHHSTGKLLEQTNWLNDQIEGRQRKWDATGDVLLCDLTWKTKKETGFCKWSEWEQEFKDGKWHGYRRHYMIPPEDIKEWQAAEQALREAGAGLCSYTLFKRAYLEWEEVYDNNKRISRTENNNPTVIEPNVDTN